MDEVLRFPLDQALIILRGQKVLKVEKFDYSLHPESKKLTPRKATEHVPEWRTLPDVAEPDFTGMVKPKPAARSRRGSKSGWEKPEPAPLYTEPRRNPDTVSEDVMIVPTDKESIMSS